MHVVVTNPVFDPTLSPQALIDRYDSLSGWCEALLAAGAARVTAVQRYAHDLDLERQGVRYLLRRDDRRPWPRTWSRLEGLHRAVAEAEPDVVHVNGLLFPLALLDLRRRLPRRVPILVQDHAARAPRAASTPLGALRRRVWRAGLRSATALLFTAAPQADAWREAGLIDSPQPVREVPEASRNVRRLPRAVARERSRLTGAPAILWVGHLTARKDPLTVVEGFARALAQLPDAQLTFVYRDTTLLAPLRDRVESSSLLLGRVHLRGPLPAEDLAAFYSAADVFVLGSHGEGSGYALLEALSSGVVPVVTDIPSFSALTAGGRLGALWPPGDATALASALTRIGRSDLESLRHQVLAHFERELSWPAVGRRALAIYREFCKPA